MAEDTMQIHDILRISSKREKELVAEVMQVLGEEKRMDAGIKRLMKQYDEESLLVGMRLMQIIRWNNSRLEPEPRQTTWQQNASLN